MYQPGGRPGGRQPEIDLSQITNRLRAGFGQFTRRFGGGGVGLIIIAVIAFIVLIWVAQGIYTLGPGEQAARRLFGKVQGSPLDEPGLHWWWPGPIGKRNVELVTQTRAMQLGFRSTPGSAVSPVLDESLMISGDLNIVDVHMVVQYDIKNLNDFLFKVDDPGDSVRGTAPGRPDGRTLKDASEAALRLVVGQRSIDDVLTDKRVDVEANTQIRLQEILDSYNTGIHIRNVQLQDVKAPDQVRVAFDDVLQAVQERDTKINQARAYENQVIPRVQGDAVRIRQEAEAFKQERILKANGEAARFTSILREYQKSKEVTRQRLYLEAMEEILPGVTKFIVSPEAQSVLVLGNDGQVTPLPIGPSAPAR
jgi:membrane protease subunit HflK